MNQQKFKETVICSVFLRALLCFSYKDLLLILCSKITKLKVIVVSFHSAELQKIDVSFALRFHLSFLYLTFFFFVQECCKTRKTKKLLAKG